MAASFEGHTDVVQTLIEAEAQINTQNEVCCSYHQKTHCTTHIAVQPLRYNDINVMAHWSHPFSLNFHSIYIFQMPKTATINTRIIALVE